MTLRLLPNGIATMSMATWKLGPDVWVCASTFFPEPFSSLDEIFHGLSTLESPPRGHSVLHLELVHHGSGVGTLVANGVPLYILSDESELSPLLEKVVNGHVVGNTITALLMHAAFLHWRGRAFLLPADARSGKSTLCAYLSRLGALYGGDDLVFVEYTTQCLVPYPKAVTLKQGSLEQFGLNPNGEDPARGPLAYWNPSPNSFAPVTPLDALDAIIVPRFSPDAPGRLHALRPELAALFLVQQIVGGLDRDTRNMEVLRKLLATPAWVIEYPSSESAVALIEQVVEELAT